MAIADVLIIRNRYTFPGLNFSTASCDSLIRDASQKNQEPKKKMGKGKDLD